MKKYFLKKCLLFFFLIFLLNAHAQDGVIHLSNPSFEDFPRPGIVPRGWDDCGAKKFPKESPPDIHPGIDFPFGVSKDAFDGATYLGFVTRENESWESVTQELSSPLQKGQCYSFSIHLTTSKVYKSSVRGKYEKLDFNTPIKLRIKGASSYCKKGDILAESPLIDHHDWREYTFKLSPKKKYEYLTLEAFFKTPTLFPYNGNILLDKASLIIPIDCDFSSMFQFSEEYKKIATNFPIKETPIKISKQRTQRISATIPSPKSPEDKSKDELTRLGSFVKFDKNELKGSKIFKVQAIAREIRKLPDHKLIIDFNGLKEKKATPRKNQIMNIFIQEGLSQSQYEIRNTKKEDDTVEWLVDKKRFWMGVKKIKTKQK